MNVLNEKFEKQAEQMMKAVQDAKVPENIKSMALEGLNKTHEAYAKFTDVTKNGAKLMEVVTAEAHSGVKSLGEKMFNDFTHNTEAAFEAAHAIAKSGSLPEAAKIQAEFVRSQMVKVGEQTKELFELSAKVAQKTIETMNSAATQTVEQIQPKVATPSRRKAM